MLKCLSLNYNCVVFASVYNNKMNIFHAISFKTFGFTANTLNDSFEINALTSSQMFHFVNLYGMQ